VELPPNIQTTQFSSNTFKRVVDEFTRLMPKANRVDAEKMYACLGFAYLNTEFGSNDADYEGMLMMQSAVRKYLAYIVLLQQKHSKG